MSRTTNVTKPSARKPRGNANEHITHAAAFSVIKHRKRSYSNAYGHICYSLQPWSNANCAAALEFAAVARIIKLKFLTRAHLRC